MYDTFHVTHHVVLQNCFPELNVQLPPKNVLTPYRGYWKDANNQKEFLKKLASKVGINSVTCFVFS